MTIDGAADRRPIHEGLFELGADGSIALIGGYSPTSTKYHFPLLDTCPYSGATDIERVLLSTDATLWAWTAVTAAPPGYNGPVPYGFGVVELGHEQLRVITRLRESDPTRLEFGRPMTLVAEELPDGVVTWAFA
ncbi:MAG: nucleic acid-binding protein [Actinomycetia bacterium]|nr:nucleic acid-binding protein [Actinomycetes bacterium]